MNIDLMTFEQLLMELSKGLKLEPKLKNENKKSLKIKGNQVLFNEIIKRLSNADQTSFEQLANKLQFYKGFEELCKNHYQENYNILERTSADQIEHLMNKYVSELKNINENAYLYYKNNPGWRTELANGGKPQLDNHKDLPPLLTAQMYAVSSEIAQLKTKQQTNTEGKLESDLSYYRNRTVKAIDSLTKAKDLPNGTRTTDLEIIKKDLSPKTTAFVAAVAVVATMTGIGFLITAALAWTSARDRGHIGFWKTKGHDVANAAKSVSANIGLPNPSKKSGGK